MAEALKRKRTLDLLFPKQSRGNNLKFYNDIRDLFKTGDLLFFSGDHWLSRLIRWRSKSAWSHVGIVIRIEEINRVFLLESTLETGVRMIPLSFVLNDYGGDNQPYGGRVAWARHFLIEKDIERQREIKEFCLDNLTKQYDRDEYFRILWRTLAGSKKLFKDEKFTCAEYIYEAYKFAKIKLPKEKGVFISPGSFWRQEAVELKAILI